MKDPIRIVMLVWLLCLTVYAVAGTSGDARQLRDVGERLQALEEGAAARAPMSWLNQAPPKTGAFKILHAPNGKWRLFRNEIWIADYGTNAEAEFGMKLCINPEVQHYDDTGRPING
jgi:hypothetical protein